MEKKQEEKIRVKRTSLLTNLESNKVLKGHTLLKGGFCFLYFWQDHKFDAFFFA